MPKHKPRGGRKFKVSSNVVSLTDTINKIMVKRTKDSARGASIRKKLARLVKPEAPPDL